MIKKTDKVRFRIPDGVFRMGKHTKSDLQQVVDGVAVSDEYTKEGKKLVRVKINDTVTTLAVENLEVL